MPKNPRRYFGSTTASTKTKRQLIRFGQHSPNSGAQVNKLNRVFTRKARYVLALLVTTTGNQAPAAAVVTASFKGYSTNPNKTDLIFLTVSQVSGPNTASLNTTFRGPLEQDVTASGMTPGIYVFKFTAKGNYAPSSGSATLTITIS